MRADSISRFQDSTSALNQILQLLPSLDNFDIETVRDAAIAIMTLGGIYSEESNATFIF